MVLVACIDDLGGMMFNKRRQSQDREVRACILNALSNNTLWMNAYSYQQFEKEADDRIFVAEDFLEKAGAEDWCFIENCYAAPYKSRIDKIVLFKWNRTYPADFYFDLPIDEWNLTSQEERKGFSHEKITKEVYVK